MSFVRNEGTGLSPHADPPRLLLRLLQENAGDLVFFQPGSRLEVKRGRQPAPGRPGRPPTVTLEITDAVAKALRGAAARPPAMLGVLIPAELLEALASPIVRPGPIKATPIGAPPKPPANLRVRSGRVPPPPRRRP